MADDQGATPRELILEAARRNNTDLLDELFKDVHSKAGGSEKAEHEIATLINESRDAVGYTPLLLTAKYCSYDAADTLLDQPMVETDPLVPSTSATPLHVAVEFANTNGQESWPAATALVELLVDAGCDPRLRDESKRKAVELVDPRNTELKDVLRRAEVMILEAQDLINEDEDDGPGEDSGTDEEV